MKVKVLTLFPEMFDGFIDTSIIKRAIDRELLEIDLINIRDFANNKHKQVDDYPYGGGAGMLLMIEPLVRALRFCRSESTLVLLTGAHGQPFSQAKARQLSQQDELIIICGHYEGIDARIENYIDEEISVGDYVLTGGELPAMVIIDAVTRLIDEVITEHSLTSESFDESLLEAPQYTKPADFEGLLVPEVLLSGHHANISLWQRERALEITRKKRPDLFEKYLREKEDAD